MAARNFADDGAVGANSNGDFGAGGGNFGGAISGPTMTDPALNSGGNFGGAINDTGIGLGARGVMGINQSGNLDPSGISGSPAAPSPSPSTSDSGGGFPSGGMGGYGGFGGGTSDSGGASPITSPVGLSFADGGAIPDADGDDDGDSNATDPQGSALGASLQRSINDAMSTVKNTLSYGRQLHGLGGGQQEAARMPMQPGNQSESGAPRQQPMPGPLPPTANPFGKRADAQDGSDDQGDDQTGVMPSQPFSETPKPQPMPGPLPPTSNPFGKRADAGGDDDEGGAIDTEEAA